MGMFAHRCALGAMGAQVERAVPAGFLPDPDAVLDLGDDRAADRAMGADGLDRLDGGRGGGLRGCGGHRAAGGADGGQATDGQAVRANRNRLPGM